ncbi:MAG: GGDEF domain-containing protein [Gammaproteobacteria bacterium]|nr:GGDEF domain-containing protein [Gammaproteobacteria bacterium]
MPDTNSAPLLTMHTAERSAEYFRLCLEHLRTHNASLHPVNYALFYHHVAGTNAYLSDRLDQITAQRRDWSDDHAVALFLRYLLPCNDAERSGLQEELANAVSHVASSAADFADSAAQHATALQRHSGRLGACTSTQQAQAVAGDLLREARDLQTLADTQAQGLLDSAQQIRKLRAELMSVRQQARTDALTGLANRTVFDREIGRLVQEKQDCNFDFSLIMMDIDHFKRINDEYGHLIGDKVLRQLANQTAGETRRNDTTARYGGEEFAILLPDTYVDQAREIAEKIRQSIGRLNMRRSDTGEPIGRITASFGVAQCAADESGTELIARADQAMYTAKNKGRNRTVVARGPTAP